MLYVTRLSDLPRGATQKKETFPSGDRYGITLTYMMYIKVNPGLAHLLHCKFCINEFTDSTVLFFSPNQYSEENQLERLTSVGGHVELQVSAATQTRRETATV